MEDSEGQGRLEERIRSLSKGAAGHEAEAEAARGLTLVKLHKGFLLCNFKVHRGVSDESGKWHEGAMTTLMDIIGSWTAFSFTSQNQVTVHLSVSSFSNPNLQETVEVEGKAMGKTGKITSVKVEVRKKEDGQTVALGIMSMAPSHPNPTRPLPSKL
ncbi:uncharacterized protein LOC114745532 isoform X1 [Neltuma alba]|uniref:uncharacterized protein LOC114745532 isoform X1 n=1 Tax=Neltuma alba TaxID=207710 RepID=UPI0010A3F4F2|nr:uncharacterized protein LOC114745532 isoform X1 [Prosopis alba]